MNTNWDIEQTPEQRECEVKQRAEYTEYRRSTCNVFLLWNACTGRACRRAKSCKGDPHACFQRWWPHVPEEMKIWVRAGFLARKAGMTPQQAAKAADAELERCRALQRRIDELAAGRTNAVVEDARAAPDSEPATASPNAAEPADTTAPRRSRLPARVRLL